MQIDLNFIIIIIIPNNNNNLSNCNNYLFYLLQSFVLKLLESLEMFIEKNQTALSQCSSLLFHDLNIQILSDEKKIN